MGNWENYCLAFYKNTDCQRKETTMSTHFDSLKDLRKHFESDTGSYRPQQFAEPSELWFRSAAGWDAAKARAYLTEHGYKGDLIMNDGGWFFKP